MVSGSNRLPSDAKRRRVRTQEINDASLSVVHKVTARSSFEVALCLQWDGLDLSCLVCRPRAVHVFSSKVQHDGVCSGDGLGFFGHAGMR